ncbi:MAG: hypothetical protein ABSF71_35225 [Terriglobia bacterium]|jgi:hypothetical protein
MPLSPEYYFCTSRLSRLVQHWEFARLPDPRAAYPLSPSQSFVLLTLMLPQIGSTKQGGKKLETIPMAREQSGGNSQTIAYHAEPFVLCGFPLRCLPVREFVHHRQNSQFPVELVANPRFGPPFDQDPPGLGSRNSPTPDDPKKKPP